MNKIDPKAFIQEKFAKYYRQNASSINPPNCLLNREFAFLLFKERMMLRHKGAKDADDFRALVKAVVPSDIYYSSAHYEKPEEDM